MIFIIGGAYQGKLDYAKEKYNLTDNDIFECCNASDIDAAKRCLNHFEEYLWYCFKNNKAVNYDYPKDTVIIMNDLFCGVVPIDKDIRAFREFAGRAGAKLTGKADSVIRIFCGLPQVLKRRTKKIYMIRHGKTQANLDFCYCGKSDLPLTETGRLELKAKLSEYCYPDKAAVAGFYTSSLARTKETLELLYPGCNADIIPGFDEMDFGDFELRRYDGDLQNDPDFVIWTSGNNESNVCPHGESNLIMKRRVLSAFDKILEVEGDAFIVSHGGPIAAVFSHYLPDSGLNYYEIQPKNGEGYCFEFDGKILVSYTRVPAVIK